MAVGAPTLNSANSFSFPPTGFSPAGPSQASLAGGQDPGAYQQALSATAGTDTWSFQGNQQNALTPSMTAGGVPTFTAPTDSAPAFGTPLATSPTTQGSTDANALSNLNLGFPSFGIPGQPGLASNQLPMPAMSPGMPMSGTQFNMLA